MVRKSSRKSSKKSSSVKSKRSSKRVSKKSSKRSSKRASRKGSRKQKGGDPLAVHRAFVKWVSDDFKLGGGPITITWASSYRSDAKKKNPTASQEEISEAAKVIYKKEKESGDAQKRYDRIKKEFEARRALKKANKA